MIVSATPGTTRDPVDSLLIWHRKKVRIVDTAGIRKAGRVARGGAVETLSVLLARRSIAQADVVVVVIDALAGATDQDAAIAGEAAEAGRGIVIAVNKWDLVEDRSPEAARAIDDEIRRRLPFLDFAPILHISALTGAKTPRLLETHRPRRRGAPAPRPDSRAESLRRGDHGRPARRSPRAAAPCGCCLRRRRAWRRRPSCSSPTSPPRCTSPTCAT